MIACPFDIINCSWPRPITQENNVWISEPEWDTPLMSTQPYPYLELIHNEWIWVLHWSDFFKYDLKTSLNGREMRYFHVIFHIQIKHNGTLILRDDDGCIIRRGNKIIHSNRNTQQVSQASIDVEAGEVLEIAQWHSTKEWIWSAYLYSSAQKTFSAPPSPVSILMPYLKRVQDKLRHPNGPPLKIYTSGRASVRAIVAIYSLILNGYVPSAIYLFGDYQWRKPDRELFKTLLPFVQIIPIAKIIVHLRNLGGSDLVDISLANWFVMKTAVALLYPPHEFCMMDDDIFILEHTDDALEAFKTHHLVYIQNYDHGVDYVETWKNIYTELPHPLPTANFNAGLYWLRNTKDPQVLATQLRQVSPKVLPQNWEQGFIAVAYAQEKGFALPFHRYYAPPMDGIPGGTLGYDYTQNPCGFTCLHFLGSFPLDKPSNGKTLHLSSRIFKDGMLPQSASE